MKHEVYIINTGRGALIETKAAIWALKHKKIGGLALDVYEQEERLFFQDVSNEIMTDDYMARLLTFNNVLVTGHQVADNIIKLIGIFHRRGSEQHLYNNNPKYSGGEIEGILK